jgi:hypothetical protein
MKNNFNKLINGDIIEVNDNEYIFIKKEKEYLYFFLLEGLYILKMDLDGKNVKLSDDNIKYPAEDEPNFLNGLSLSFRELLVSTPIPDTFKVLTNINTDNDIKEKYLIKLNKYAKNIFTSTLINSHQHLKYLIMFSKCFNKFTETESIQSIEIGDILTDNLQSFLTYQDYKEFDIHMDENYWIVIDRTENGFYAINLHTFKLFHFTSDGIATHFVNDIDGRYNSITKEHGGLQPEVLNHYHNSLLQPGKVCVSDEFYVKELINDDSFFDGLKLLKNANLNNTEKGVAITRILRNILIYRMEVTDFKSSEDRNIFELIEKNYAKSNGEEFSTYTFSKFDNNSTFEYPYIEGTHYYERDLCSNYIDNYYKLMDVFEKNIDYKKVPTTSLELKDKLIRFNHDKTFIIKYLNSINFGNSSKQILNYHKYVNASIEFLKFRYPDIMNNISEEIEIEFMVLNLNDTSIVS